ncbi:MAG TPA: hypothetical protein VJQ51_14445 [Burkholderiales bacterium]|nr:hypothetical protein [Burkholderiales bacterium]
MPASPSDRMAQALWTGGAICAAVFALAFAVAPRSCEGGLETYFWSGVAAIVVLFIIPVAMRSDLSALKRAAFGLGFSALGAATWMGGLFVANVRIMCRLF